MRLLVADIRAARTLQESTELDPQILSGDSRDHVKFNRPLKVDVEAQMTENDIIVTGKISTQAAFSCARCLTEFETPVTGNFQEAFALDLETIDLTELIRESVWVDIPLRALCKEGCLGLCSQCGVNKNTTACACKAQKEEPPFRGLREFRFK